MCVYYIGAYAYMHMYIHIYMYVYIHVYVYMHIYILIYANIFQLLSHLPERVLKLMAMVGFNADRKKAEADLSDVSADEENLRNRLSSLLLFGYNMYLEHVFGEPPRTLFSLY